MVQAVYLTSTDVPGVYFPEMETDSVTHLILQYRYWALIPLTFIEGPIVAFAAGMLASMGYFNMYFLAALFLIRDVGLDGVYYAIGHYGGRTAFAKRMLTKIGITPDNLEQVREMWNKRPGITMFFGKLSYGIAASFIVVAGMVRMSLVRFFTYGVIVAVLQYGGLLLAGYYFGVGLGGNIVHIISNIQYAIGIAALIIATYYFLSWRMRQRFLAVEKRSRFR